MLTPPRFIARHLAHPKGLLGRIVGHMMNRHNAKLNAFAVEKLVLSPSDRVLELGFGGGVILPSLVEKAAFVAGVDRSQAMVERARKTFKRAVAAGQAAFHVADVEALPFETATLDKVCTVNTIYFWSSLERGFSELRRVLTPGGRMVIGFLAKNRMDAMGFPKDIFTSCSPEHVVSVLESLSFRDVCIDRLDASSDFTIVVATKAAAPT